MQNNNCNGFRVDYFHLENSTLLKIILQLTNLESLATLFQAGIANHNLR